MQSRQRPIMYMLPCAALWAAVVAQPALAREDQAEIRKLQATGAILPLEKISASAKAIKPGEILETELEQRKGITIYEVEILDAAGQVWELRLDAKTGKLIKIESEH